MRVTRCDARVVVVEVDRAGAVAVLACGESNSGNIYMRSVADRLLSRTHQVVLLMPVSGSNNKSFFNVLEAKVAILGLQ